MMHPHEQEERDAWFSRADRFDGFDRGDDGRDHDADQLARNEAEAEAEARKLPPREPGKILRSLAAAVSLVLPGCYSMMDSYHRAVVAPAVASTQRFADNVCAEYGDDSPACGRTMIRSLRGGVSGITVCETLPSGGLNCSTR